MQRSDFLTASTIVACSIADVRAAAAQSPAPEESHAPDTSYQQFDELLSFFR